MRVSIRRFALVLSLPALVAIPAYAQDAYYDDGQPPAAIALFSSQNFQGDVREAFDPFGSMHDLAFNDRARSVAVLAGQWELCEHADFTGRCVFIREDVADLGWFDLNGRVSSIRPIFEYTEAQHGLMFTRDNNGYIRYAHNEAYGYDTWNYGYSSSVRLSVQHYGYSPDYWRFGYYDPRWGYDPYGFAWRPYGGPRYVSYTYRVHPRPVVINTYWKSHWGKSHKYWDRRGHRDDWRRKPDWRGDPGRGPGRGKDGWDRDRDRDRDWGRDRDWDKDRDRDRDRGDGRPGRGGDGRGGGVPPRERIDERDRAWGPGDRGGRGGDGPRTDGPRAGTGVIPTDPRRGDGGGRGSWGNGGRDGGAAIVTPPREDRGSRGDGRGRGEGRGEGRGDWRGDRDGSGRGRDGGRRGGRDASPVVPVSPPVAAPSPSPGRPDFGGSRGEGRGRGDGGLLGAPGGGSRPVADTPRRGGGGEGGWRGDRGGRGGGSAPSVSSPPTPPPTAVSRPAPPPRIERGPRGDGGGDRGGRGGRRPGSAQD